MEQRNEQLIQQMMQRKIIAIVRGLSPEQMVPVVDALYRGGIRMVEVTFNQSDPNGETMLSESLRRLTAHFTDRMQIGAGTVLTATQVQIAADAGARFIISPNVSETVIRETLRQSLISIPGALTPSEIMRAHELGAHFVKLFPAGSMGIDYFKAIRAPISHVRMMAVGGIGAADMADWIKAGAAGFGIGGSLVSQALISGGRFDELAELATRFTSAVS